MSGRLIRLSSEGEQIDKVVEDTVNLGAYLLTTHHALGGIFIRLLNDEVLSNLKERESGVRSVRRAYLILH